MKLDPTKPYATVHGATDGRRFEQNGRFFNGEGEMLEAATPIGIEPTREPFPRRRTKEEEAQYVRDVADAAALLAAGKK